MTKRTKLLSLMIAMVMCFACGIMMMTSTAKAEVEVPTVAESEMRTDLDWSTGKNFDSVAVCVSDGLSTDWFVFEYYVPANTTLAAETIIQFGLVVKGNFASYPRIDTPEEVDGVFAKTTYAVAVDSSYETNATDKDVKVRLAMDLANGKVYGSIADAEFEEIASFANFAYVSNADSLIPYIVLGGKPSNKRLNNVRLYTEEGIISTYRANNPGNVHHGAASFNADRITSINISAEKPTGNEVSYVLNGSVNLINANPTTSDWIIYEYTIGAGSTYTNAQNGVYTALSNNGWLSAEVTTVNESRHGYLHTFASSVAPQTIGNNLFAATEDTAVKMAVNTKTGLFAYYRNGSWTTYSGVYNASSISGTDRYYGIVSNGAKFNGTIKDVVCYDGEGVDLGVKSTLVKVADPKLPATAVKPEVDNAYYANDGLLIKNATATTAEHIIIEYTLKAGIGITTEGGAVPQNGIISTLSTDGTHIHTDTAGSIDGMLYGFGSTPKVHVPYDWFMADSADIAVKLVINTKTGSVFASKNGAPYAEYAIHTTASEFTAEERYFSIGTNAPVGQGITGWVEDLVCYDSNGVNLGVTTDAKFNQIVEGKVVDILENLGCNNVGGGRYIGNIYFKDLEGNDIEGFCLGKFTAYKNGTEQATLEFVAASVEDKAFQLFSPQSNGFATGNSGEDWQWEDVFNNQWYVVKAGTVLGGKVKLAEDMIIRMHGATMQIFNASSVSFNITYEGVGDAENTNATSYSYASSVTLADLEKENAVFAGWYVGEEKVDEIAFGDFFGDITVTAKWQVIDLIKYNAEIVYGNLYVNFYATIENVDEDDIVATINDGEAEIEFDEARNAYAITTPVLLYAIGDVEVEVAILLNDIEVATASVNVYEYLLAIAKGEGEFAALAADVLALADAQYDLFVEMIPELEAVYSGVDISEIEVSEVTLPEVGAGEIGLRDENNKWSEVSVDYIAEVGMMFVEFTFTTTVEGTINIELNGESDDFEVDEGAVVVEMPLLAIFANAKLVFKAYDGETQIGNDLVINMAGLIAELDVSDAAKNYLVRTVALYNSLAAYFAD